MQSGIDPEFFQLFAKGVQDYLAGNWSVARDALNRCEELRGEDGPTKSLLRVMGNHGFEAPSDWKGYRMLTDK